MSPGPGTELLPPLHFLGLHVIRFDARKPQKQTVDQSLSPKSGSKSLLINLSKKMTTKSVEENSLRCLRFISSSHGCPILISFALPCEVHQHTLPPFGVKPGIQMQGPRAVQVRGRVPGLPTNHVSTERRELGCTHHLKNVNIWRC